MNTRNWIIAAVAVVLLFAIYFFVFQPGAEAPKEITAPPGTNETAPAQRLAGRAPDTGNGGGRFSCREPMP